MASADEATGQIKRGFVWLGAASIVTRVLDAVFTLGVLWLVSKEELGIATLAWSIGVFIEAFNGLGITTAVIQFQKLEDGVLSDVFWYTMGIAAALITLVWLGSPWLSDLWGQSALTPLIRASAFKLLFVGAALVPLSLLNRELRFERIAVANTCATFGSGASTMLLAWMGQGSWAFIIGQLVYGFTIMVAAFALQPFLPRLRFDFARVKPLSVFGIRAAAATIVYHLYRNADYFFMGRYLGVAAVGVYRVGFELAMTPTVTLLNVVNRSSLPAYSRLQDDPPALAGAMLWTTRSLSLMLAPITVLLAFGSGDLLALINHGEWIEAAPVTSWLAWAAFLRSLTHVFPQVFYALGRPALALWESVLSALVLSLAFVVVLQGYGPAYGIVTVGWGWFASGAILLLLVFMMTQRVLPLSFAALGRSLRGASFGIAWMCAVQVGLTMVLPAGLPSLVKLAVRIVSAAVTYMAYLRVGLRMRWSDLRSGPAA